MQRFIQGVGVWGSEGLGIWGSGGLKVWGSGGLGSGGLDLKRHSQEGQDSKSRFLVPKLGNLGLESDERKF